jgi:hypothetical protein
MSQIGGAHGDGRHDNTGGPALPSLGHLLLNRPSLCLPQLGSLLAGQLLDGLALLPLLLSALALQLLLRHPPPSTDTRPAHRKGVPIITHHISHPLCLAPGPVPPVSNIARTAASRSCLSASL